MKHTDKHMHVTDTIEPSANYNKRLIEDASDVSPAGELDAAIPIDPRVNMIVSEKDGVSYFTGCDTGTPRTVLDVIDSTAGHEATAHVVYAETYAAARRVFASLLESQCLIETVIDIYYQEDSKFVYFEPADRSADYRSGRAVELFVNRHSVSTSNFDGPDNEAVSETDTELSSEMEADTLRSYLRCWLANTTPESPSGVGTLSRMLESVDGLNKANRTGGQDGLQRYWRLDERVWDFDRGV